MVEKYYKHEFDVKPEDVKSGDPALFKAVLANNANLVKELLDKGADPNDVYTFDDPDFGKNKTYKRLSVPLAAAKSIEIAKLLIEHGASVNTKELGEDRYVPLVEAVRWGRIDVVKYLLEQPGIDIYDSELRYLSNDEMEERAYTDRDWKNPVTMTAFQAVFVGRHGPELGQDDSETRRKLKDLMVDAHKKNPNQQEYYWW